MATTCPTTPATPAPPQDRHLRPPGLQRGRQHRRLPRGAGRGDATRDPTSTFEFVYVDDGSRDDSLAQLLELRADDDRVTVLSLSRNFGHQIAVTAGLDACADADAVIVMDTDLQDPPRVSLEMIDLWEGGVDVVFAQRRSRRDSAFKRATAWGFYWLLDRMASIEIPRNVGDFRLMDRKVVAEVSRYREHDRFLRGIVAHVGFRQEALLFDRDERHAGDTGYPLRTMIRFAASGILGFSTAPLRWISRLGLRDLGALGAAGVYVAGVRIFAPEQSVPGWAFLGVGMFLLSGLQLIMMGVIGTYLGPGLRRDPGPAALLPGPRRARSARTCP